MPSRRDFLVGAGAAGAATLVAQPARVEVPPRIEVRRHLIDYAPRRQFIPFHNRTERWACMVCHRRAGKALDIETLIPVYPRGFKRMADLQDGDIVFDETGYPANVVEVHPVQIGRPCYSVEFDDGAAIVCDEDHLWYTETKADRTWRDGRYIKGNGGNQKRGIGVQNRKKGTAKTTSEIRDTLIARGENNHAIPLAGAVGYPTKNLPIDPYILGLWLGDGTSRRAHFTTMDKEIVVELDRYASVIGMAFHEVSSNSGQAKTYAISGGKVASLTRRLRKQNLILNKHIPRDYVYSSIDQRVDLLRGLMDTDGSIDPRKGRACEITQKNKQLAEGILQLLRSLGEKPTINEKIVNGTSYWRVAFNPLFNPFRLERKRKHFIAPKQTATGRARRIVSVESVKSRPVRCITVDSPSHLYLAGEHMIPTHNTVACVNDLIKGAVIDNKPDGRYGFIAPFRGQVKEAAWYYLKKFAAPLLAAPPNESELRVTIFNGAMIRLYGADNPDSIRGTFFDDVTLDEYADMRPSLWSDVVRPMLTDRRGRATFIGTPKGKNAFFELMHGSNDGKWPGAVKHDDWYTMTLKASESGILPQDELDAALVDIGADLFMQEFECSFETAIHGAFYAEEMRRAQAQNRIRVLFPERAIRVHTAWDLGRRDSTAIWFIQCVGPERRLIDYYESSGVTLDHYAEVLESKKRSAKNPDGYLYGNHYLPHDIAVKELISEKSRKETLEGLIGEIQVVPMHNPLDGINAVRRMLDNTFIDPDKCRRGLEALRQYRREWDDHLKDWKTNPLHDWSSHGADALRTFAVGHDEPDLPRQEDRTRRNRDAPQSAWGV